MIHKINCRCTKPHRSSWFSGRGMSPIFARQSYFSPLFHVHVYWSSSFCGSQGSIYRWPW